MVTNPIVDKLTGLEYDVFIRRNSAYILLEGPLSWRQARNKARNLGGSLATIGSQRENDFITRKFQSMAADECGLWIGLNSLKTPGKFYWNNGSKARYRNWVKAGTPGYSSALPIDDPSKKFVHIYFNPNALGYWKNSDNTYHDVMISGGIAEFSL